MNTRIFLLAQQADQQARTVLPDLREVARYNRIRDEVFAQLIVRECSGIAYEYDIPNLTGPGEFIGNRIKKHFGVEL